jgi:ketosteroid isomerase-like protein
MKRHPLKLARLALATLFLVALQPLPPGAPIAYAAPISRADCASLIVFGPMLVDCISDWAKAGNAPVETASMSGPQPGARIPSRSSVTAAVDLNITSDPAKRKATEEFLATAIAKEQAYYNGDVERFLSFYADNVVSTYPEVQETVGKAALAEGLKPYMEGNKIVGNMIIKRVWLNGNQATRQAEWEEWVTPKDGSAAEHHIGRCTLNWEKINGEWKVISEFVNYLEPPTPFEQ